MFDFSTLSLFKCTKRDYAEQFCHGQLYFGTPRNWIDFENKGNIGQGDLLEGVFLACDIKDNSDIIKELKTNSEIENFEQNGICYFRRKSVLDLRCFCLYGLHDNSFTKIIDSNGRAHYKTAITKEYFSDFSNCKNRDHYKEINYNDQPVVVLISNPKLFFERIVAFLHTLDINDDDFIIAPVTYMNKKRFHFARVKTPYELLNKDIRFEHQSEVRIIINSKCEKYKKYMSEHNNKIDVGSLEDITSIYDYYFDDMTIEREGNNRLWFSLPDPRPLDVNKIGFLELEDLLISILAGKIKLENIPQEANTWQDKLKFITDQFYDRFGVSVFIDDNKNITMINMSTDLIQEHNNKHKNDHLLLSFVNNIESLINDNKTEIALVECEKEYDNAILSGAAYYYTGKINSILNNVPEAQLAFYQSYKRDYKRIESLDGIASLFFNIGHYDEALSLYNEIQNEKGYDSDIWFNIGLCLLNLGRYYEAIDYFDKCIDYNGSCADAYFNKAIALYLLNNSEESKAFFLKAIELYPDNETYKQEYKKRFQI